MLVGEIDSETVSMKKAVQDSEQGRGQRVRAAAARRQGARACTVFSSAHFLMRWSPSHFPLLAGV